MSMCVCDIIIMSLCLGWGEGRLVPMQKGLGAHVPGDPRKQE